MSGAAVFQPTLADVREYVERLYRETQTPDIPEAAHVAKMKKYLNFLGEGVEPTGRFLHDMRRATTEADLFRTCAAFLDHQQPMPLEAPTPA